MIKVSVEKTLIYGCAHVPYQDRKACDAMFDFIKYWKPDRIISNGDGNDLWSASRFFKFPDRKYNLQDEADESRAFHATLRKAAGKNAEIIYNFGNHDFRYDVYLQSNAPEFTQVRELAYEKLFGLEENGITVNRGHRGNYARYKLGNITVGHFEVARMHSAYTEQALVSTNGCTLVASHSHRKGVFYKTLMNGTVLQGMGTGHMCDEQQADYIETPNWQKGFIIVEKLENKPRYFMTDINVLGGNILHDGRLY